jgi:hypothetical protein
MYQQPNGDAEILERGREKAASREIDARALASGEKSREQLRVENGAFAFPRARIRLVRPQRSKF